MLWQMERQAGTQSLISVQLRIGGQVQAVGFRPFTYRLALKHRLNGWVENHGAEVQLLFQGAAGHVDDAITELLQQPPPLARPVLLERSLCNIDTLNSFTIRSSQDKSRAQPHIPPDYFLCDDCLQELNDPADRRYRYPFINCTQCGPRYTLIEQLPYDRARTTMAGFPLCAACEAEYNDPGNRRFHAEPIACPRCGPQLSLSVNGDTAGTTEESLRTTVELLQAGKVVAVKGIGGYHLMCDASSESAVARLRQRKRRPHKPLAVMFPQSGDDGLAALRASLVLTPAEEELLLSPLRPIVICRQQANSTLAENLAPGLRETGAMLPYSPLHHLLLQAFGAPLVATSGNISGEPVLTDNREAEQRLESIADSFLHHNRPIRRPADDPLYRESAGRLRPLRLGRGNAPQEQALPFVLERPLLAVGGEMKNSVALAWQERAILSPHIGELGSPRGQDVFTAVIEDLQALYGIQDPILVHDAHPGYHASRWALDQGGETRAVYHHHAHASAIYGEHWPEDRDTPWLVATWDGVGYGADATLWGGESLLGRPGQWQRFARLRPFRLPGGEKAGREPWRSALALCLETGTDWPQAPVAASLLTQAWERNLNSPSTTAAGRLFDAAAALLGLCHETSFEGQAGMLLEAVAGEGRDDISLPLQRQPSGVWQSDWEPLLARLLAPGSVAEKAADLHHSLANVLLDHALQARREHGITTVGLGGGVFQNRYLVNCAVKRLLEAGFSVRLATTIPCNDGGLAWGQLIEAAALCNNIFATR